MNFQDDVPVDLNTHRTEMIILSILVLVVKLSTYQHGRA